MFQKWVFCCVLFFLSVDLILAEMLKRRNDDSESDYKRHFPFWKAKHVAVSVTFIYWCDPCAITSMVQNKACIKLTTILAHLSAL